ncbi:MAG: hypothetical protein J6K45_04825 [Clostridia bacterium]|nr:hypothetical protein [Clostridia bacterium]
MFLNTNKRKNQLITTLLNSNGVISGNIKLEYEVVYFNVYEMTYTIKVTLSYKHSRSDTGIVFTPFLQVDNFKNVGNKFNCNNEISSKYVKIHEITYSNSLKTYSANAVRISWGCNSNIFDYIDLTLLSPNFGVSKINGNLKHTIAYVKVRNEWKRAMGYVKKDNQWLKVGYFRYWAERRKVGRYL